jgi:hypothetical protein
MENFTIGNSDYDVKKCDWHYENDHQNVNQDDNYDGFIGV